MSSKQPGKHQQVGAGSRNRVTGSVKSLWRYPVKSMLGEELQSVQVSRKGLLGDRSYAVVDTSDSQIASAKSPRKWSGLFECRTELAAPPTEDGSAPVRITLPDGTTFSSDQRNLDQTLSEKLGREVCLCSVTSGESASAYEYDRSSLGEGSGKPTNEVVTSGTFFDDAVVHVMTTATLDALVELYPQGCFDVRRFRPNVVLEVDGASGFVENDWPGRTLSTDSGVKLGLLYPCPRCVMVNLSQKDLPKDPGILRTVAQHNGGNAGIYAAVLQGGRISANDRIMLD